MHELTASEATTVLSVLSRGRAGELPDAAPFGIPASTFFATRRKIYDAGWLSDRYVPNPWAVGVRSIDCILVRPSPAVRARLEREWASSAESVLLWSGVNVLLALFFRVGDRRQTVDGGTTVSITGDSGSVPVYFDFSRAWSRFVRVERDTGYPRPLGDGLGPGEPRFRSGVREMVLGDLNVPDPSPGAHRWHSHAALSRSQLRLLEQGVVRSRTFLNLDTVPPYEGRALGEVVFLSGDLREGVSAATVLGALDNECRVSPFLLADDGKKILILALGQVGTGASRRTPVPRAVTPVAATLDRTLRNLQMTIEPTGSVRKIIDHRYDRLWPARARDAGG